MEGFVVKTDDLDLQKAFIAKLEEKGITRNPGDPYWRKNILLKEGWNHYGFLGGAYCSRTAYELPRQWNEAVEALEQITRPKFKVGDWIKQGNFEEASDRVFQIKEIKGDKLWFWDEYGSYVFLRPDRAIHATKEEIKQELIKRSGLEIGDKIRDLDGIEDNIKGFDLRTSGGGSGQTREFFRKHGIHLAVQTTWLNHLLPVAHVEKLENNLDFYIPTDSGEKHKPKVVNNHIHIGSEEDGLDLSSYDLLKIKGFMDFCRRKELSLSFDIHGDILDYYYNGWGGSKTISVDEVEQMIDALEE